LQKAYDDATKASERADKELSHAWLEAGPLLGLIAAKLKDGFIFEHFALADLAGIVLPKQPDQFTASICSKDATFAKTASEDKVRDALTRGIFGQTKRQFRGAFSEVAMMRQRYRETIGQEPPEADVVEAAWVGVADAWKQATDAMPDLAEEFLARAHRKMVC